jgi:hypothetical protein
MVDTSQEILTGKTGRSKGRMPTKRKNAHREERSMIGSAKWEKIGKITYLSIKLQHART